MNFSDLKVGDYFRFIGSNVLCRKLFLTRQYLNAETLNTGDSPSTLGVILCDEKGKNIERKLKFSEIPDGSFFTTGDDLHLYVRLKIRNHMITFFNDNNAPTIHTSTDKPHWKLTTKPDWLKINI